MSGETEQSVSGWTVDTLHQSVNVRLNDLKELLDERATTQKTAMDAALAAAEKAVGKAETAAEKRFDSVNEFRAQLADQATTFPTRIEMTTRLDGMSEKISDLSSRLDRIEGSDNGRADLTRILYALGGLLLLAASVATGLILAFN